MDHYIYKSETQTVELIFLEESEDTEGGMQQLADFLYQMILKYYDDSE